MATHQAAAAPPRQVGTGALARLDRLGLLLVALAAGGLASLPFLTFKANRIAAGAGKTLADTLGTAVAAAFLAVLALVAAVALLDRRPRVRLAAALLGVGAMALAVGFGAGWLTPPGDRFARVAPGGGAWLLLLALALLATDALARLGLSPLLRMAALAGAAAVTVLAFRSGLFDQLSVMREYASRADVFGREARQHLLLAGGSVAAAILIGAPLGALCALSPRIRGAVLPVLNVVQTIPSIALFGLLMGPLAWLGRTQPWAAELGIRGIGAAPALLALTLYALLPVAANTALGLGRVPATAVDAAAGMGMTRRQILARIEIPLALPVILAGVRVVLVQNIGLATIAALIGGGGLGTFVFQGVGQTAIDLVLLGAAPTVAMAFVAAVLLDAVVDALGRRPA
ncbi:ABC transporter permease [Alsobacter metallidurans]|uniref:ABC transporter permease n=1 Tax=Alsobacter metallidurans TaxID=340221 RepID=A0A917I5G6_9HYPH|nr:ABC transporter permease [Alsobacter metallidurans]GGH12980.1 ABC transporter permease [Alsobacter metallidurans]